MTPQKDTASLRLIVEVRYDLNGTQADDLECQLRRAADHLAGEGLLSGDTEACVTRWSRRVESLDQK